MDIKARINARKIVLSYLYQHCFFRNVEKKDLIMTDALFADYIFKTDNEKYDIAKEQLKDKLHQYEYITTQEGFEEFTETFFDAWEKKDIDFDYVFQVASALPVYEDEVIHAINAHKISFGYEEMDTMDQAIFLLGYIERKTLGTPREVLLNEVVELAKRYSDEGAPKLINGIMHKVLSE